MNKNDDPKRLLAILELAAGNLRAFAEKMEDDAQMAAQAHLEELEVLLMPFESKTHGYSPLAANIRSEVWRQIRGEAPSP